jgi:molybdopterin-guanine dinucleotide biosynthesis protein A
MGRNQQRTRTARMTIDVADITGLVLAGGRGSRMGGIDKGLQLHRGTPLAQHALRRLAPQVASTMLNANRNLDIYAAMGVPVWADEVPDFSGPLAGMLAGLCHCATPYLATVPCDSPDFPLDLVARLARGLTDSDAEIAVAAVIEAGEERSQPVFCLLRSSLQGSLATFLASGERKTGLWIRRHRHTQVRFEDARAFLNVNTLLELGQIQGGPG